MADDSHCLEQTVAFSCVKGKKEALKESSKEPLKQSKRKEEKQWQE
jgi:hypothetical protein